ncbi:hypothetical protein [uncultured Nostoc sp.]|uniref:hypothetical protein n=1 Tax=uncultured Nostoc sp. TaxID=340711 RepID=UPI0035CB308B
MDLSKTSVPFSLGLSLSQKEKGSHCVAVRPALFGGFPTVGDWRTRRGVPRVVASGVRRARDKPGNPSRAVAPQPTLVLVFGFNPSVLFYKSQNNDRIFCCREKWGAFT